MRTGPGTRRPAAALRPLRFSRLSFTLGRTAHKTNVTCSPKTEAGRKGGPLKRSTRETHTTHRQT